jgi:hypothetical protein
MTASTLRLMSCCDSCCHSRCNAASNWRMFCTGGSRASIRRPNMSQLCSMGFKSGLMAGQGTEVTASLWRKAATALERWGLAFSSIYTGLVATWWLSKWGTTTGCETSLMYWSPVRLPCMVTKSSLQLWEIHPKPLLSLHRKGQLDGCSLGYRLYFCVSKPSSGRRLYEAETGSRLTNGSCAMSLNSTHVVLKTPCQTWSSMSVCQQWTFNDSPWLKFRWFQTASNCSWQTSIGQPVLFEYGTGCEWHPSNQTLQCPVVTIRCYP